MKSRAAAPCVVLLVGLLGCSSEGGSEGDDGSGSGGKGGKGGAAGKAGAAGSAQAGLGGASGKGGGFPGGGTAGQGGSAQAGQGGSSQAGKGGSSQAGSGGSSQAGSGGSSQAGGGGSSQAGQGGSAQAGAGGTSMEGGAGGAAPFCGDGVCNGGENCTACPADCGQCPPSCGDGTCNNGETKCTCPGDCGAPGCGECNNPACGPTCGDGTCEGGESCVSCAGDCGACPVELGDPFFAISPDQGSFLDGQAKVLRSLGAGMVRLQVGGWNDPNSHAFLSQSVDAARAAGLNVYVELNYATIGGDIKSWHANFSDGGNQFNWDFAKAAGEIAEFLKGRVFAYEIWNEPDATPCPSSGSCGPPSGFPSPDNADWDGACGAYVYGEVFGQPWGLCPKQLGVITTNAYLAIKDKDPAAKVVAGNVLFHGDDGWVGKEYWKKVEQSGAVDWFKKNKGGGKPPWDYVGIHPYAYPSNPGCGQPTSLGAQLDSFKSILGSYGDPASVAITEYGWDTIQRPNNACTYVDEGTQATRLLDTFSVAKQKGLGFVVWFNYLDAPGDALNYGIRRYEGGGPGGWKPAAKAFCQASGASACPAP